MGSRSRHRASGCEGLWKSWWTKLVERRTLFVTVALVFNSPCCSLHVYNMSATQLSTIKSFSIIIHVSMQFYQKLYSSLAATNFKDCVLLMIRRDSALPVVEKNSVITLP